MNQSIIRDSIIDWLVHQGRLYVSLGTGMCYIYLLHICINDFVIDCVSYLNIFVKPNA
jgi:hypothetical protein